MARDQQAQTHLQTSYDTAETAIFQFRVRVVGTLAQFAVDCGTAPAGGSVSFTLWKITGGVSTAIVTLLLTSGATSASVNLSQSVAVGDLISVDMSLPPSPFGDPLTISVDIAETGATATDAFLLSRANHTGSNPDIPQRQTSDYTTASLANGAVENGVTACAKGIWAIRVEADRACWVRIYNSIAARTADAGRPITTDITPGSGVMVDVILPDSNGFLWVALDPEQAIHNNDTPLTINVPISIMNRSGAAHTVMVTLTWQRIE